MRENLDGRDFRELPEGREIRERRDFREVRDFRGIIESREWGCPGFDWKVEVCLMVLMVGVLTGDLVWTGLMIAATAAVLMRGRIDAAIRRMSDMISNEKKGLK